MKSCFVIFLSIFTISIVKSQLDNNTIYLCKYDFTRQIDSTNKKSRFTDIMYLEIGSESSKYYSHLKQLGIRNSSNDQAMKKPIEEMMQNHSNYYSEAESEIITHLLKSGKRKVTDQFKNTYCYTVPITVPDWKIQRDTKERGYPKERVEAEMDKRRDDSAQSSPLDWREQDLGPPR